MILQNIKIEKAVNEGKCLSRVDKMVVFTERTVPGDIADLDIYKKKKNYAEARVVEFHARGENYTQPFCEHFDWCSGCKWQQMQYPAQLTMKQQNVEELLVSIAKVELPEIKPIIGSVLTRGYRNKVEYTFTHKKWVPSLDQLDREEHKALGYHIAGRFDKVLDINACHLQEDTGNSIRNFVKAYALEHQLTFFDLRAQKGFLRNMILRNNTRGEWMVIMIFHIDEPELGIPLLDALKTRFPEITSLCYVINGKQNDTINDLEVKTYSGRSYLEETIATLVYRISPKAFFQVNVPQARTMYGIAKEFAGINKDDIVYDLYTGTGSIACFVAGECNKVVGLEYIEEAVIDARENARINGIENALFFSGDIKDILDDSFFEDHGRPDILITDPPRTGMHEDVVRQILKASPRRIIYISCNVATQARDMAILDAQYRVTRVQPIDMFPHTSHVENIVCLDLR
jgi:23S rRNA (uracil1939-C5)-methyltransferase